MTAVGPLVSSLSAQQIGPDRVAIQWQQAAAGAVSLEVVNLAGQPVASVCRNLAYAAGAAVAYWPRRATGVLRVPAGMYVIVLEARDEGGMCWRLTAPLRLR